MLTEKMLQKLNQQVEKEFFSAYLYLSMEAYLRSINLDGFANWFQVQLQEERYHAMAFYNYIDKVNGKIELGAIEQPRHDFSSPLEIFELGLEHEQYVTKLIYDLMDLAIETKDHTTQIFLQWFITEQAEEEENMTRIINRLKLINADSAGLFMLDTELAQRMYVASIIPV